MHDKWLEDWKRTKKEFESLTGKKKPSGKFLKLFHSSGVESALKTCDSCIEGLDKNWDKGDQKRLKSQQDMRKAIDNYKKAAKKYDGELDDAIVGESIANPDQKTVYYRGLKMLRAKLEQYGASYEESLAFDQAKLAKDEQFSDKHWKIAEQKLKTGVAKATAAAKTAATAIAKNGDDAWPEFITQIPLGIRELSWAFGDVKTARQNGVDLPDPAKFEKALDTLQKALPNRPGVIGAVDMAGYTKNLAQVVKEVKAAYKV
jgi:hypothetical protein